MRILMIEDDKQLCDVVCMQLRLDGYETDACYNGAEADYYLDNSIYDMILLDRMLPGKDGITLLHEIRQNGIGTPVILVTALGELDDKIEGLDAGADDYLAKPYSVEELKARIRALQRRPHNLMQSKTIQVGDITLDDTQLLLCKGNESCSLSKKESHLLAYFLQNYGQILSREQILAKVWGAERFVETSNVDTYVCFIRRRLKTVNSHLHIKSVHGVGYKLIGEQE